jgi:hypothetical protein
MAYVPQKPTSMRNCDGYTLMQREGGGARVEIWHYDSDTLKHIAPSWIAAITWARLNRAVRTVARQMPKHR